MVRLNSYLKWPKGNVQVPHVLFFSDEIPQKQFTWYKQTQVNVPVGKMEQSCLSKKESKWWWASERTSKWWASFK